MRLDLALVARGLAPTREKAQALIMAGDVRVAGQVVTKASVTVLENVEITVDKPLPFVSRGGLKLQAALDYFIITPTGWQCLDIGVAHGGFTDCLLQAGVAKVVAVDVGESSLDYRISKEPRVEYYPHTNFRLWLADKYAEKFDLVVIDVSFISITLLLEKIYSLLKPKGLLLALVKPQFEVGKAEVERGGVVRDAAKHQQIMAKINAKAASLGFLSLDAFPSPVKGKKMGNQEFLSLFQKV